MPREDRRISFEYAEIYKAIYALCLQRQMHQPFPGAITAVDFKDGIDATLVIEFTDELRGTSARMEYGRDFLAAALVLYCRTCGIPIPKKGRKFIELGGDGVTLRIVM